MASIKGTNAPTRKTVGALGDIYTDTNTGKQYKCVFSYKSAADEKFDCQWVEIKGSVKNVEPEAQKDEKEDGVVIGIDLDNGPDLTSPEPVAEEPVKEDRPKQNKNNNRTNYTSYNKKNK